MVAFYCGIQSGHGKKEYNTNCMYKLLATLKTVSKVDHTLLPKMRTAVNTIGII
jgi:hypothetical protein